MSGFRYGDVVWADFDPSAGHERAKRRPAVIVSNDGYNAFSSLVMVVPVATAGTYPLHVDIGEVPGEGGRGPVRGWAEAEQLKSPGLAARRAVRVASLPDAPLGRVTGMVLGCLMRPTMEVRDRA